MDSLERLMLQMQPQWLPTDTQLKLKELGWDLLRQTYISMGRECPAKLHHFLRDQKNPELAAKKAKHPRFLIGSAIHYGFEFSDRLQQAIGAGEELAFWSEAFWSVLQDGQRYDVNQRDIDLFCKTLANPEKWGGRTMGWIIIEIMMLLESNGYKVLKREGNVQLHCAYVTFGGTFDLLLEKDGRLTLADVKSFGISKIVMERKGTPSAIKLAKRQIASSSQLEHYSWMYWRINGVRVDRVGYIFPSNSVPVMRGPKKGQPRGPRFQSCNSLGLEEQYEANLVEFLGAFANGMSYKGYPTVYGRSTCGDCAYYERCFTRKRTLTAVDEAALPEVDISWLTTS